MLFGTITIVYGAAALVSFLLLMGYLILVKKKAVNLLLLFVSVFVVNLGYVTLSASNTVEEAMLANRIAYLGSVFLPLFMLLIIQDACRVRCGRALLGLLIGISIGVFLLAASGGYCDLYYREVSLRIVDGSAVLEKVYGPFHVVYLLYLIAYFGMMVITIVRALVKKRISSAKHAAILASLVLGNIVVWFVEQKIPLDFEFLSVSYIVTELFLLFLYDMLQEYNAMQGLLESRTDPAGAMPAAPAAQEAPVQTQVLPPEPVPSPEDQFLTPLRIRQILQAWPGMQLLTAREAEVLRALLENRRRRDIAEVMYVSENTVKKHTSNIFAKLGVGNRRELCAKLDRETPAGSSEAEFSQ